MGDPGDAEGVSTPQADHLRPGRLRCPPLRAGRATGPADEPVGAFGEEPVRHLRTVLTSTPKRPTAGATGQPSTITTSTIASPVSASR